MKFFARINDKQVGPLTLTELVESGVRPSDYIWHKGMPDWMRADEVPDVCRGMRRYLAGYDPETGELRTRRDDTVGNDDMSAPMYGEAIKDKPSESPDEENVRQWMRSLPEGPDTTDYTKKPRGVSIIVAILVTLLCFPLTGLIALWYGFKSVAHWKTSCMEDVNPNEKMEHQRQAHNYARLYKMMIGISIFMGMIMVGFALFRL